MKISILTLFPEYFKQPLQTSMLGKAVENDCVTYNVLDIRAFAPGKHRVTDARPYGGGPGMVMKIEPIYNALKSLGIADKSSRSATTKVLLTSAKGDLFTQQRAESMTDLSHLILICGHYEGVDERVATQLADGEIRIGNYVITGGEPAALVIADAVTRLIPGVLGNDESTTNESHTTQGIAGTPQYTRPETFHDWTVPHVLLEGNHAKITAWRESQQKKLDD